MVEVRVGLGLGLKRLGLWLGLLGRSFRFQTTSFSDLKCFEKFLVKKLFFVKKIVFCYFVAKLILKHFSFFFSLF